MRRRQLLTVGGTIVLGTLAGCSGDNGEESESTPTSEPADTESAAQTTAQTAEGESRFNVEASTTEIDWGERFEVTITAQGGEDAMTKGSTVVYQTEEDSTWAGSYGETEYIWQLGAGETETETFEIQPTKTGEHTMALMTSDNEKIAEWKLTVKSPTAVFGEPISFYDGLDLTLDAELHEWLEFELKWGYPEEKTGMFSVHPKDGQWVKVSLTAENTNTNEEVSLPEPENFSGLGGNSQLDHYTGREPVGGDTEYELDEIEDEWDMSSGEDRPYLDVKYDDYSQEGYWKPPNNLISGAVEEGWLLFEADADVTADDIEIRLNRNDIRATWG